jgi:hypothetical protein
LTAAQLQWEEHQEREQGRGDKNSKGGQRTQADTIWHSNINHGR